MTSGKELTVALLCEQRELVGRLHALSARIEETKNPASKVRSKVEYAKEREHYVQLLRKVRLSPHSDLSACNLAHPASYAWECGELRTNAPGPSPDSCFSSRGDGGSN